MAFGKKTASVSDPKDKDSEKKESKSNKKICCACPNTKRLRDECIAEHGPENCTKWINAHLRCLRGEGFNV